MDEQGAPIPEDSHSGALLEAAEPAGQRQADVETRKPEPSIQEAAAAASEEEPEPPSSSDRYKACVSKR